MAGSIGAGDPSLRLKNGFAQDDTIERASHGKLKLRHYRALWAYRATVTTLFCHFGNLDGLIPQVHS